MAGNASSESTPPLSFTTSNTVRRHVIKSALGHGKRSFEVQIALLGFLVLFGITTVSGFEATVTGNWTVEPTESRFHASGNGDGGILLDTPDLLGWSATVQLFEDPNFESMVFGLRGTLVGNPGKALLCVGIGRLAAELENTARSYYMYDLKDVRVTSYAVEIWNGDAHQASWGVPAALMQFDKNRDGKLSLLEGDEQFQFSTDEHGLPPFRVSCRKVLTGTPVASAVVSAAAAAVWHIALEEPVLFEVKGESFSGDRICFVLRDSGKLPPLGIDVWEDAYAVMKTEGAFGADFSDVRVHEGAVLNNVPLLAGGGANIQRTDDHVRVTEIMDSGEDGVAVPLADSAPDATHLDVNGDGFVSPLDALQIHFTLWDLNNNGTFDFVSEKASLFVQASGTLSDGSNAKLGRLGVCNQGGATAVCFDDNRAGGSTRVPRH
jgi:hypothetical protein